MVLDLIRDLLFKDGFSFGGTERCLDYLFRSQQEHLTAIADEINEMDDVLEVR